jgi:hypothetical protein
MAPKTKRNLGAALAVGALIIVIIGLVWFFQNRYKTTLVPGTADGGTITLACDPGQTIKVISAKYSPTDTKVKPTVVTSKLQSTLDSFNGLSYTVDSKTLLAGTAVPGSLVFRYKCVGAPTKAGFRPMPVQACGARSTFVNSGHPPGMARRVNRIRNLAKFAHPESQPGHPNYMEDVDTSMNTLMANVTRRSAPQNAHIGASLLAHAEIDSDFTSDGIYDGPVHETLVSRPHTRANELTASHTGAGSIKHDPRFEYSHPSHTAHDTMWAHGGHSGNESMGNFGNHRFHPPNQWHHQPNYASNIGM